MWYIVYILIIYRYMWRSLAVWTVIFTRPALSLQHALDLQLAVANILQLLVNSERNQQVLCEACLHQRLLQRCSQALGDEDHPLHPPLQRMFERLASQALQPMALRYTARLRIIFVVPNTFISKQNTRLTREIAFTLKSSVNCDFAESFCRNWN